MENCTEIETLARLVTSTCAKQDSRYELLNAVLVQAAIITAVLAIVLALFKEFFQSTNALTELPSSEKLGIIDQTTTVATTKMLDDSSREFRRKLVNLSRLIFWLYISMFIFVITSTFVNSVGIHISYYEETVDKFRLDVGEIKIIFGCVHLVVVIYLIHMITSVMKIQLRHSPGQSTQ